MSSLTHHDILRLARPLVERGWRIDLSACSREQRRIVCLPSTVDPDGSQGVMVLESIDEDTVELTRAAAWSCPGRADLDGVASLSARVALDDLTALVRLMDASPDSARAVLGERALLVRDDVLLPQSQVGRGETAAARRLTRSVRIVCPPLVLDIDASTSAGNPADIRLWHVDAPPSGQQEQLASGAWHPDASPTARAARQFFTGTSRPAEWHEASNRTVDAATARALLHTVPDDLLAILAPRWRVLRWQGGYWKGALALTGRSRDTALTRTANDAMHGLQDFVSEPGDWHERHRKVRWRVFARRLKPFMMLLAILGVMPVAWLATSHGNMELHPLLLGITPLLMVAMIALSAREIPVMEWPPRPAPLPDDTADALSAPDP